MYFCALSENMKSLFLKPTFLLITGLLALSSSAQLNPSVVFSVANHDVSVDEFERQFIKSLPRSSDSITAKLLDEYLKLYIDFKLKYQDAKDAGLDTVSTYKAELDGYRQDLARNYLYDKEVTESLMAEAYERWKYDVRVSHLLVYLKEDATPADTLDAYKKIMGIAEQLKKDPTQFGELAKTSSDDPGTKENGGDLGYFTVFQLVYPFESVAYNTNIGEVSKVFRTQFGYHILKVTDKRKNRGEMKVRRLLLRVGHKPEATDDAVKAKIDEMYAKLLAGGTTLDALARSYSEDFQSKASGGEVDYLSATQKVADLEFQQWADKVFELQNNGELSKPFRTAIGWHIVQRLDLKPVGTFAQLRSIIKNQVQGDIRSQKSLDALIAKVKSENGFIENPLALKLFVACLDSNFHKGQFKRSNLPKNVPTPKDAKSGKMVKIGAPLQQDMDMFALAGEKHDLGEFADFVESAIKPATGSNTEITNNLYKEWVGAECVEYQDRHLEEKNMEFKFLYQEYREGILMFNRMQIVVWDKANSDSIGLAAFYKEHSKEYMWKDRFDCQVYLCANESIMKSTAKMLKKKTNPDSIKKFQNVTSQLNLDYRVGKYELTDSFLFPDKKVLELLFSDPKYRKANKIVKLNHIGNDWVVIKVNQFIPSMAKQLDETRGPVAAKYQDYLEKQWIESLRAKYKVVTNEAAFQALKTKLVNQ